MQSFYFVTGKPTSVKKLFDTAIRGVFRETKPGLRQPRKFLICRWKLTKIYKS